MKKLLLILVFFYVGFILFMPKINLYYTLESLLQKEHIVIQEGGLHDRWIDLDIQNSVVLYDGVASVQADSITITPWLFSNSIHALNVGPTVAIKRLLDVHADDVLLTYALWDYKYVHIEASGDFGVISGRVDVLAQTVHLVLTPSAKFKNHDVVRQYFKKTEEGLVYDTKL